MAKNIEAQPPSAEAGSTIPKGRTRASQGRGWLNIYRAAQNIISTRPDDHLSSVVAELRELDISRKDPNRFYRTRELVNPIGKAILAKADHKLDNTFYHPTVTNSRYSVAGVSNARYMLEHCMRPDTTAVMELGSGWSCNLFQMFIGWGATRSQKTIYYGGEYTAEGQRTGKYIARIDDKLQYRGFNFDYREPDLRFLKNQRGHILLFTTHSVEQVDIIDPVMFEHLAELEHDVTVVHFEPVGWQRDETLYNARINGDDAFFENLGENINKRLTSKRKVIENSAWWSWRLNYNVNLLQIIADLESRNLITVQNREYDYAGAANIFNPSSLIHYEFNR